MKLEAERGYYISFVGLSSSNPVDVYGLTLVLGVPDLGSFEPVVPVSPVEAVYHITRDPSTFYISRFPPFPNKTNAAFMGRPKNGVSISSSPELIAAFEESAPSWLQQREQWHKKRKDAFEAGMKKAGLTWADRPVCAHTEDPDEMCRDCVRLDTQFVRRALEHTEYPAPLLVRITGLDNLLSQIPISDQ